ncbi:GNAT family N-acetyltransferase [Sphingomonas sp. RS2018]
MIILETDRLILRHIDVADAPYVLALQTDPAFIANIGDRGMRTVEDAATAITERYATAYASNGFGMLAVIERASGAWVGTAGLVRRDGLEHVDIGYALLPAGRGCGYAFEAARAVLDWAAARRIAPVVAIVNADNAPSISVLTKLGLVADRPIRLPGAPHDVILYIPKDMKRG